MKYSENTAFYCVNEEEVRQILKYLQDYNGNELRDVHVFGNNSNTIGIDLDSEKQFYLGHCNKKWYEDNGYNVLLASDVLKNLYNYEIY